MRIKGFDILHFAVVIKLILEDKHIETALNEAIIDIRQYIPDFHIDKSSFLSEYNKLRLQKGVSNEK